MLVYKQYNQEQLDLQYNNRYHVPDFETSLQRWENLSRLADKKYRLDRDIPYGTLSRESLDIFPSPHPGSRTLIFIHGGYWQMFDKSSFHFVAGAFARYGISTVLINYPLAPLASMDQIVTSCRKAVRWLHENLVKYNGDPAEIYLSGHSAGGHLAAMSMTMDEARSKEHYVKGVCTISGIFDLIPIQLSRINAVLQMDSSIVGRNSPVHLTPEGCPMIIAVGAAETNEFKNQSSELYHHWKNKNHSLELLEIPGLNHFTILDSVYEVDSPLHQAFCKLMNVHFPPTE